MPILLYQLQEAFDKNKESFEYNIILEKITDIISIKQNVITTESWYLIWQTWEYEVAWSYSYNALCFGFCPWKFGSNSVKISAGLLVLGSVSETFSLVVTE